MSGHVIHRNDSVRFPPKTGTGRMPVNDLAAIEHLAKRLRHWHAALEAAAAFVMANAPGADEAAGAPVPMKYAKKTWLPLAESRLLDVLDDEGGYQTKHIRRALAGVKECGVAIDVGANIGLWSRVLARHFQVVHCFEPQAMARACLARNAPFNNVVIYPFALGAGSGEVDLNVNRLALGGAMIDMTGRVKSALTEKYLSAAERVLVRALDDFNLAPDFVKIDVQGFESEVLRGSERTLKTHKPVIICEAGGGVDKMSGRDDSAEAREILSGYGFVEADRVGNDLIMVARC